MLMGFSGCFLQGYYDMAAAFTSQDLKVFVHAGQISSVPEGQKKDRFQKKKSRPAAAARADKIQHLYMVCMVMKAST